MSACLMSRLGSLAIFTTILRAILAELSLPHPLLRSRPEPFPPSFSVAFLF